MKPMNMNQLMNDVHQNAIDHGWWDEPRSYGTIRALFHCELSEAMEAYRKGQPLYYVQEDGKPDGVAVELIDCCIRILDYMANEKLTLLTGNPYKLMLNSVDAYEVENGSVTDYELPDFVDEMHDCITYFKEENDPVWLDAMIGLCFAWVKTRGVDPVAVMKEKHEYNKTRTYKHGGKVC